MRIVLANSQRLGSLVDDLLELSRIESGALDLQLSSVDLGETTRALLRQLEPRFKERRIETAVSDEAAPMAWADRRAVEQILTNLLENALKYTEPGGRVDVRIAAVDEQPSVEVADSGIGIRPEDQARIFERFYRVDKARSRASGGTGLGLAIVKHWVQALGGTIEVESELGKGSRFRFSLPLARPLQVEPVAADRPDVLFMCVANSARSQLAEGFARKLAPAGCRVYSAGSIPTTVHPSAVVVMAEVGVDLSDHFSKSVDDIPLDRIGTFITLCEEEVCPAVPGVVERLHWGFPDPAGHDESDEESLARFRAVRDAIEIRLREWFDD
jgi:protein-tyrosine-phosphatase/two-component sensor histidine kinase